MSSARLLITCLLLTCVLPATPAQDELSSPRIGDGMPAVEEEAPPKSTRPDFSLSLRLGSEIPVGAYSEYYISSFSSSIPVRALEVHGFIPLDESLSLSTSGGFIHHAGAWDKDIYTNLDSYWFSGGAAYTHRFLPWLRLRASASAGYGYSMLTDSSTMYEENDSSFVTLLGAEALFSLGKNFDLGLALTQRSFWGLFHGVGVSITAGYNLFRSDWTAPRQQGLPLTPEELKVEREPEHEAGELLITGPSFAPVFPVLHKYYEHTRFGSITVKNTGREPLEDITIRLFVHGYMDVERAVSDPFDLSRREERKLGIKALFNNQLLDITESTVATAELGVEYSKNGKEFSTTIPLSLRILDRTAINWEDDRRIAAFVTAKDPAVLRISRTVAGITSETRTTAIDDALRKAMGMYCAMDLLGLKYVVDPRTPYEDYADTSNAVDFLQFPRQTLEYHGGDCDDLSILFCALLESVGVETGFITVPGHIFPTFQVAPSLASSSPGSFSRRGFIEQNDAFWLPIEITALNQGFLHAWGEGTKQWREHAPGGRAQLQPTHRAWKEYEPVGLPGAGGAGAGLETSELTGRFEDELKEYIHSAISEREAILRQNIAESGGNPHHLNRLGVLYAKYGLLEKASAMFQSALAKADYLPALLNLGNIHFLHREFDTARDYYERAQRTNGNHPSVLLALARVHHELENYGIVRTAYEKLRTVKPTLAADYSYLASRGQAGGRALSSSEVFSRMHWEE